MLFAVLIARETLECALVVLTVVIITALFIHNKVTTAALMKKAESGDVNAMNELGYRLFVYAGEPEWDEAARWFKRAAEEGEQLSRFNLAVCYEYGCGVPTDIDKAKSLFFELFNEGDMDAALHLGNICARQGFARGAIAMYENGSEASPKCKETLARCYAHGFGVEQNVAKSKELRKEAKRIKYAPPDWKMTGDRTGEWRVSYLKQANVTRTITFNEIVVKK